MILKMTSFITASWMINYLFENFKRKTCRIRKNQQQNLTAGRWMLELILIICTLRICLWHKWSKVRPFCIFVFQKRHPRRLIDSNKLHFWIKVYLISYMFFRFIMCFFTNGRIYKIKVTILKFVMHLYFMLKKKK